MKKIILFFSMILFILLTKINASEYPMGLTKELWDSLDKEKQIELIIEQKRLQHEKEMLSKKEEILLRQKNDFNNQQTQQYGDIVIVNFNSGITKHSKYEKNILPQSFLISKGETKEVELQVQKQGKNYIQKETVFIHFAPNSNQIEIFAETQSDRRKRITLLNNGKWNQGVAYENLNVVSSKYIALHNVSISVRFHDKERGFDERKPHRKW